MFDAIGNKIQGGINALGEWLDNHFPHWQIHFQKKGVAYKIFAWIYGEEELQGTFCQGIWKTLGKMLSGVGGGLGNALDNASERAAGSRALQLVFYAFVLAVGAGMVVLTVLDPLQMLLGVVLMVAIVLGAVIGLGTVVGLIAFASKHLCPIKFAVREERV